MINTVNTQRLAQIEAQLTNGTLTDTELATALTEAGLPELARVVSRLARQTGQQ